ILPDRAWHAMTAAGLVGVMLALAIRRRFSAASRHLLLHPHHLREDAGVVNLLPEPAVDGRRTRGEGRRAFFTAGTTLGVRVSRDIRGKGSGSGYEYSLSGEEPARTDSALRALARYIVRCRHPSDPYETAFGEAGSMRVRVSSGGRSPISPGASSGAGP